MEDDDDEDDDDDADSGLNTLINEVYDQFDD